MQKQNFLIPGRGMPRRLIVIIKKFGQAFRPPTQERARKLIIKKLIIKKSFGAGPGSESPSRTCLQCNLTPCSDTVENIDCRPNAPSGGQRLTCGEQPRPALRGALARVSQS